MCYRRDDLSNTEEIPCADPNIRVRTQESASRTARGSTDPEEGPAERPESAARTEASG